MCAMVVFERGMCPGGRMSGHLARRQLPVSHHAPQRRPYVINIARLRPRQTIARRSAGARQSIARQSVHYDLGPQCRHNAYPVSYRHVVRYSKRLRHTPSTSHNINLLPSISTFSFLTSVVIELLHATDPLTPKSCPN